MIKNDKTHKSDFTASRSDINSTIKALGNSPIEPLDLLEAEPDRSSQRDRYKTYKIDNDLKVILPVNDRYKEALDFCTFCMANTAS